MTAQVVQPQGWPPSGIWGAQHGTLLVLWEGKNLELARWLARCTSSSALGPLLVTPIELLWHRLILEASSGLCRILKAEAQGQEASSGFLISRLPGSDSPHPDLCSPGRQAVGSPILVGSGVTEQAVTK